MILFTVCIKRYSPPNLRLHHIIGLRRRCNIRVCSGKSIQMLNKTNRKAVHEISNFEENLKNQRKNTKIYANATQEKDCQSPS